MLFNNPIDLVDGHGLMEFDTLHNFYLKALQLLYHDFPKGYIDYKVFLHEHTLLRGTPLSECCKCIERSWEESEGFCIEVPWTNGVQANAKLTVLLRKMSRHTTGSYFDLSEFDKVWKVFSQSIKKE